MAAHHKPRTPHVNAERAGKYLSLHFDSGGEGGIGSVVRLKQGEGARRVWAYLASKCTVKIETA